MLIGQLPKCQLVRLLLSVHVNVRLLKEMATEGTLNKIGSK